MMAKGMRLGRWHGRAPAAILLAVVGMAPGAAGAEATAEAGRMHYVEACAGCHGMDATGDGPAAALLTVDVPDLTGLARRDGGNYDLVRVIQTMDGRQGLAAHGGPMPLFGGLLTGPSAVIDGPEGMPVQTTEPILAIALWLETLQEATP